LSAKKLSIAFFSLTLPLVALARVALSVVAFSLVALSFVELPLVAQTPAAVPAAQEPHHHPVLENPYMRALRVNIAAGDATLLHIHNVPYVYVSLGSADFANAVEGKPEARVKLVDGQVGYSRGGFSHLVRTDAGIPFNNVTVELLHPQGEPKNLCDKIVPGDAGPCDMVGDAPNASIATRPLLATEEIRVSMVTVRKSGVTDQPYAQPGLLVAVSGASIKVANVPGAATLHAGEVIWLPLGAEPKFTLSDGAEARLMLISFNDGKKVAAH
jgi:quercetin dioxygenase-like cupin family protein